MSTEDSFDRLGENRRKQLRRLLIRKYRRKEQAFLAEGERLIRDLAMAGLPIHFLYGTAEGLTRVDDLDGSIPRAVTDELELFETESSQEVGAVATIPPFSTLERVPAGKPVLLLDRIQDPGNLGTLIRSASWFGIGGVAMMRGTCDPFNPKAVRASMGGVARIPLVEVEDLEDLSRTRRRLYTLDARAEISLGEHTPDPSGIYVLGNEAEGIDSDLASMATGLRIPGGGSAESLNVAMSGAILCYELGRGHSD